MTITIHYPNSGHTRTQRNLSQAQINGLITSLSDMNEEVDIPVRITVSEDRTH